MELHEIIHLYIGQDALLPFRRIKRFTGYSAMHQTCLFGVHGVCYNIGSIKLLLRPLSDMTSEERQHMCICPVDLHKGPTELQADKVTCHTAEKTAYLLSRGFDLFGLIERGLAIDETKNK